MEISLQLENKFNEFKVEKSIITTKSDVENLQANDKLDINNVWDAVDSLFDLGDSNIFSWVKLTKEEQGKFWEIVSKLIKAGIIGYRYYEVNGHLERHFVEIEMVNPELANAKVKLIDKRQYSRQWFV
jgi:hypothetical protein